MFNGGIRGKRANDNQGTVNPQNKFIQTKSPQPYISGYTISGTDDTALDPAGGQTVLVNGTGFATGISATLAGTQIGSVTLISSTQISFTSPAKAGGSYSLVVYNSTGGAAILVPGLTYSSVPTFTTAAGSIGSYYETTAISTSVVATSDSSITYSLASGSLPSGATLYGNGVITGTSPVDSSSTTYTFAITATDAELQDVTGTFTLTINTDVVSWSSPADGATYNLVGNQVMSNVSLSATSAAGYGVTYTANALPTGVTLNSGTISGTPTVAASSSTLLTATAATTSRTATRTINWVVTLGDSYWKNVSLLLNGSTPTTTFINDASLMNNQITIQGDTKPNNFNPYSNGYYGFYAPTNNDYWYYTDNSAFGTGDFTVELWLNSLSNSSVNAIIAPTTNNWQIATYLNGFYWQENGGNLSGMGFNIPLNQWNHIACARSGGYLSVWVNGTRQYYATNSFNYSATGARYLGGAGGGTNSPWYTSNIRIIKGTGLYSGTTISVPTSPLTAVSGTVLLTYQSNRAIDNSPLNVSLTINGSPKIVSANPFAPPITASYYTGYSVAFDGTGDYISFPSTPAYNVASGSYTIEGWYYFKSVSIAGQYFFAFDGVSGTYNPMMFLWVDGTIYFRYFETGGEIVTPFASGMVTNTWYHWAVTRVGNTYTIYKNGTQVATGTNTNIYSESKSLKIGANLNGYVSNFRLTYGSAVYTGTFTVPTTALATTQSSGTNIAAISAFPSQGYSVYFDGSGDTYSIAGNAGPIGTEDFTWECWMNISSYGGSYPRILESSVTSSFQVYFSGGTLVGAINGGAQLVTYSMSALTSQWVHCCITRTGSAMRMFINGVLRSYTASGGANFVSGGNSWQTTTEGSGIVGYLSNMRVVRGSVVSDYSTSSTTTGTTIFTPPTSPLTAISGTQFLGMQSSTLIDNSTNRYTITVSGPYISGAVSPFASSYVSLLTCQNATLFDNSHIAATITSYADAKPVTVTPFTMTTSSIATTSLGSAYFDGTGDFLKIADESSSTNGLFALIDKNFTYECWVNFSAYPGGNEGALWNQWYGVGGQCIFTLLSSGYLSFTWDQNGTGGTSFNGTTRQVPLNSWTHVAVVRNNGTLTLYVNGLADGTTYNIGSQAIDYYGGYNKQPSIAARGGYGSAGSFTGYISDFRVTIGTAAYTSNFLPPQTPLTAITNSVVLTLQYNGGANNNGFVDQSSFNNPAARTGNVTQGTFSPYSQTGWSNYFDGTGDYLQTSASSTTAILGSPGYIATTSTITVECWIYQTTRQTFNFGCVVGDMGTNGSIYWGFGPNASGNLSFYWASSSGNNQALGNDTIPLNTWTHIALSINSGAIKLFVNGVLQTNSGSATTTNQSGTFNYLLVGGFYTFGSSYGYFGYVSNLRITKAALYTGSFTPSTTPLVASETTGLLICQSNSIVDNSPNNIAVTTNGDTSVQAYSPFGGTTSVPASYSNYFDGSGDYLALPSGPNTKFELGTGDWNLEMWLYPTTSGSTQVLFDIYDANSAGRFTIQLLGAGTISLRGAGGIGYTTTTGTVTYNQWNHVAISKASGSTRIFIAGTQSNTTYSDSNNYTCTTGVIYIGANGANGANNYAGYISNFRLVQGQALYTTNFTPSTTPLTTTSQGATASNVSVLTCQSNRIIDNSTNYFTLTANGDVKPRPFNPFGTTNTTGVSYTPSVNSGSMYFDGTGDYLTLPGITLGTSDFTIECWIYPTALPASQGVLIGTTWGGGNYQLFIDGNPLRLTWQMYTASSPNVSGYLRLNAWQHISWVRTGGSTNYLFVNGVKIDTTSSSYDSGVQSSTFVGDRGSGQGLGFIGYMSDMKVTVGKGLYTANFYPSAAPATPTTTIGSTTYTSSLLLSGTSGGIIDYHSTNDLETVGNTQLASEDPYAGSYYSNYSDGNGDYLTVPSASWTTLAGTFTLEFWIRWNVAPSSGTITGVYANSGFTFYSDGTRISPNLYGTGNIFSSTFLTASVVLGKWYHLAVTRDSSNLMTMWVDGVSAGSTTTATTYTQGTWYIFSFNNTNVIQGNISNYRVNNTCLYTTNFTPSTIPLTAVAGTQLLTCQSYKFKDNSTNAATLTPAGTVAVKSTNPFQQNTGKSLYFDGTGDYMVSGPRSTYSMGTGNFTVECWIYSISNTAGSGNGIFDFNTSAAFGSSFSLVLVSNQLYDSATGAQGSTTIVNGTWNHVAMVRSSGTQKTYLNGVQQTTGTVNINQTQTYFLVGGYYSTSNLFNGYIKDLRITNGIARYTTTFTPPIEPAQTK